MCAVPKSISIPFTLHCSIIPNSFVLFQVMQTLEHQNVDWYTRLVGPLSEQDKKSLQEVFTLANQRRNARESRHIEQAGGN